MFRILAFLCLIIFSLLNSIPALAKQKVEFYIYIDKPPFIVDKEQQIGLSYDFIAALNAYSVKYHYVVTYLPKNRAIDFSLGNSGVLWTNPYWINDSEMVKYSWIENLILDRELYITNDPFLTYQGLESLYGKSIVVVREHNYFNLDEFFQEDKVTRIDVHDEKTIPLMLLNKRGDIGVISFQTYEYIKRTNSQLKDTLYTLEGYQKEVNRSILVDKSKPELKQDIENWLSSDLGSIQWQAIKDKWLYVHF